jgi:four helix bundle protein
VCDEDFPVSDLGPNELRYPAVETGEFKVSEETSSPTREKSFAFAIAVIGLYKRLLEMKEFVISKQLLRSGTSIGANVEEAVAASSRRDFLHRMTIASKEARETVYWIRLLDESDLVTDLDVTEELESARELVRLLTSIVKTTKESSP